MRVTDGPLETREDVGFRDAQQLRNLNRGEQLGRRCGAARGARTRVEFMEGDAEALPFGTKSVDCLMSIRFLFHVDPQTRRELLAAGIAGSR